MEVTVILIGFRCPTESEAQYCCHATPARGSLVIQMKEYPVRLSIEYCGV